MAFVENTRLLCRMIKIEHSIFALPFAFMGAFAAVRGVPPATDLILLTVAMVCIRSYAMAFNRIVDVEYDRRNPRTANRPLVTGELTSLHAWFFCGIMALCFIFICSRMNALCLALTPVVLFTAAFYSYTKRFTWLCHFVLGLVLAMAPMAGYLALTGKFSLPPLLLSASVVFWVAGFDIFYACQDVDFDSRNKLHSVPVHFGIPAGLAIAGFCHANTVIFLFLAGYAFNFAWPWHVITGAVTVLLIWEHSIVKPNDLSRLNMAFFTINGCVAVLLFFGILAALYV